MDEKEFYELASKPGFPNTMDMILEAVNPDNLNTFSREGVEGIVSQMDNFIMARIFGRWKETNKPPKKMRVTVSIDWGDFVVEGISQFNPWFHGVTEDIGLTQADGEHRSRIFKDS